MSAHIPAIRALLARGPMGARQLIETIGISQPTLSRALTTLGTEVLRMGAARSIRYALRDSGRSLTDLPIYRVGADGRVRALGVLVPVRPNGFVMQQTDGISLHSEGLPWWLLDMRPQGFLGRAYVARHAVTLGSPTRLAEWDDSHALRALVAHGHDVVGNLLLGDVARERFVSAALPAAIPPNELGATYAHLASVAARGEAPGSSAGGEQPKFTAYAHTPQGPRHVLVKFTLPDLNPVTERWRDLLLAEHHALATLAAAGVSATRSRLVDHAGQRFLELERFDRVDALGRRALFSLGSLEAEFVGDARQPWPVLAARLAQEGCITPASVSATSLLYAFGVLIGNTDMHNGNLSFTSEHGRPYELAPAYDMLPMGLAPRASGDLPQQLPPASLHASVPSPVWAQALDMAADYLDRLRAEERFSPGFATAGLNSLAAHLQAAKAAVVRLD